MSTLTSREFNQDTGRAKKQALDGPVYITDRGKPSHVLMSYEEYKSITEKSASIGDLLSMDGIEDVEFNPGKMIDKPQATEF